MVVSDSQFATLHDEFSTADRKGRSRLLVLAQNLAEGTQFELRVIDALKKSGYRYGTYFVGHAYELALLKLGNQRKVGQAIFLELLIAERNRRPSFRRRHH